MRRFYKILLILLLVGCNAPKTAKLPDGMVPKRKNLPQEVHGGYVRLLTTNNINHHGEFIGMKEDSLVIWENEILLFHRHQVEQAQIYLFDYNTYLGGFMLSIIPNLALLAHIPAYGLGPLYMATLFSAVNLLGAGTAEYTETQKVNFHDWNLNRSEFLQFARFPHGVPTDIPIYSIKGKNIPDRK